ncbi:unnamed protein product [Sphagnum troendelagicum]|uniref:Uncharacterized protein n=1 Tax=Sphagnum troendelagicum TaxID=128251 RepID=A0ABP0UFA7_9BRYO
MQCCILGVFLKTVSFPALGSDQAHPAGSSETRVRQEDDVLEGPLPERSLKAGGTLNGRGDSKGLPISQSSGQLGSMKAAGSSESDDTEVELPPAMTCIPLEINITPHRYSVPESKVLTSTTHFPQLFHLQFSTYGIYISIFSPPTYGRHHEVPLKELNSVQPENGKKDCSKKSGRLQIERKIVVYPKNSRHCKLSTFFLKMWRVSQRLRDLLLLRSLAMASYGPEIKSDVLNLKVLSIIMTWMWGGNVFFIQFAMSCDRHE